MFPECTELALEDEQEDEDDGSDADALKAVESNEDDDADDEQTAECDDTGKHYCSLDNYFVRIGQVCKVQRLCLQVKKDIQERNHKYLAHQLALLFHVLVRVVPKDKAAEFKARIEERFQEAKTILDSSTDHILTPELCNWAECIANDVLKSVISQRSLAFMNPINTFLSS